MLLVKLHQNENADFERRKKLIQGVVSHHKTFYLKENLEKSFA